MPLDSPRIGGYGRGGEHASREGTFAYPTIVENATRNPVAFSFFSLYFPPSVTVTLYSYYFF